MRLADGELARSQLDTHRNTTTSTSTIPSNATTAARTTNRLGAGEWLASRTPGMIFQFEQGTETALARDVCGSQAPSRGGSDV
jgi:hypothetical protein